MAMRFFLFVIVLAVTCLLAGVQGRLITFDHQSLRGVRAEIHPIKGSGGEIVLRDLFFSIEGDAPVVVDVVVVEVPDECPGNADMIEGATATSNCQWPQKGLGILRTDNPITDMCCTQDMVNNGQCSQVNRAIINGQNQLQHRYVSVAPGSDPLRLTYNEFQAPEAGNYALLILNCHADEKVQLNGKVEWESYPGGYEVWQEAGLELVSDAEQMARTCDIDVDFFSNMNGAQDEADFIQIVQDYLSDLATTCTDDQVDAMNAAFDDFYTCSDFDLQQFIEDLPSAVLGTAVECLVTMDWTQLQDVDWNDFEEVANIQVSDACLDFEFGTQNAVGHGLWEMALFPDKTMACFKEIAPKIPACTLSIYPVPIVGGWLKPAACLVGELPTVYDDVLKIEMGIWAQCLPETTAPARTCENDCLYQGSFLMRGGNLALPVSDTMERLASSDTSGQLQTALNRYKKYLGECTEEWTGWTDYDGSSKAERHINNNNMNTNSGGGGARGFFDFVMLLVGLFLGAVFAVVYERSRRRKAYEQTEKQLELTEGNYVDTDTDNEML